MSDLPPGFVLDKNPAASSAALPPGFVLDKPASGAPTQPASEGKAEGGSTLGALWDGLVHGAGNVIHGGARIGARMGEATDYGFGPELPKGTTERVDKIAKDREETYQASPSRKAHPIASKVGEIGGEVAGMAAEMGPLAVASPGTMPMRMLWNTLLGTTASLATPKGGESMAPGAQLQRGAFGAAGGAVGGAVGEVAGSLLSKAIAGNSPQAVDSYLTSKFRQVVKPGRGGQGSAPQLDMQDQRMLTAVDQIIANRPNLKLTDPVRGETQGQLPRSLHQFAESIDQTKRSIFQQYDALAKQAEGVKGVRVELAPVISQLRELAKKPEIVDFHPNLAAEAERMASTFEARGSYSPGEAQDIIQNLNQTLSGFYRNPTNETVSHAAMLGPVSRTLREGLDKAIEGATGPGYQALRLRYGALRSIEKDVANAVQREANKVPGGIGGIFSDLAASEEAIRGIVTLNPAALMRAGGIKAAQQAMKYVRGPNRAIDRLFSRAASRGPSPGPVRQGIGSAMEYSIPPQGGIAGGQIGGEIAAPKQREARPSIVGP